MQGSSVCGIFDETLACTGLSMKQINLLPDNVKEYAELKKNVCSVYAHPGQHVDFMPNARKVHLKIIFDKRNGKVLGAQCAGKESVVKQIDTIAAFIQMGATVEDLAHAELCYAPAFGSARGPVNIVGQLGFYFCLFFFFVFFFCFFLFLFFL